MPEKLFGIAVDSVISTPIRFRSIVVDVPPAMLIPYTELPEIKLGEPPSASPMVVFDGPRLVGSSPPNELMRIPLWPFPSFNSPVLSVPIKLPRIAVESIRCPTMAMPKLVLPEMMFRALTTPSTVPSSISAPPIVV